MQYYRIPRYLDEPDKVFFLYTDEILTGLCTGILVWVLVSGWLAFPAAWCGISWKRQSRNSKYGCLKEALLYWALPAKTLGYKQFISSQFRDFIG